MQVKRDITKLIKFSCKFRSYYSKKNSWNVSGHTDVENGEKHLRKICCLDRIFWRADRFLHIQKKNKPIKKSFVEESVAFTFLYQTNENHATEPSKVGHVILRTALERYFRFHCNCKQLLVEARNSMPNCEIYFSIFSETIIKIWKYFHSMVLEVQVEVAVKKIGC